MLRRAPYRACVSTPRSRLISRPSLVHYSAPKIIVAPSQRSILSLRRCMTTTAMPAANETSNATTTPPSSSTPPPPQSHQKPAAPPEQKKKSSSSSSSSSSPTPEEWKAANKAFFDEIEAQINEDKFSLAENNLRNIIKEISMRFGTESHVIGDPLWSLANLFSLQLKLKEAMQCWKRLIFLEEKWGDGKATLKLARAYLRAADTAIHQEDIIGAEKLNAKFIEVWKTLPPTPESKNAAVASRKIAAEILVASEEFERANKIYEDLLKNWTQHMTVADRVSVLEAYAISYEGMKKHRFALDVLTLCKQIVRKHMGVNTLEELRIEQAFARCYYAMRQYEKSLEHGLTALNMCDRHFPGAVEWKITSQMHIADALLELKQFDEAVQHYGEILDGTKHHSELSTFFPLVSQTMLMLLVRQDKLEEAERRALDLVDMIGGGRQPKEDDPKGPLMQDALNWVKAIRKKIAEKKEKEKEEKEKKEKESN